jgi:hypothetical protein
MRMTTGSAAVGFSGLWQLSAVNTLIVRREQKLLLALYSSTVQILDVHIVELHVMASAEFKNNFPFEQAFGPTRKIAEKIDCNSFWEHDDRGKQPSFKCYKD